MQFRSEKYRFLVVRLGLGHKVKFDRGVAEVEGEAAERLLDFARRHPGYEIHADEAPEPAEDDSAEGDEKSYGSMSKRALVAEAVARDLDESGTKADLIARLEADDAEDEAEDEADAGSDDESTDE